MEELKLNIEDLEKRTAPGLLCGGINVGIGVGVNLGGGYDANCSGGHDSGSGSGSHGSNEDHEENSCSS